eukprot:6732390-Prymnesium_polylepis.1
MSSVVAPWGLALLWHCSIRSRYPDPLSSRVRVHVPRSHRHDGSETIIVRGGQSRSSFQGRGTD